MKCPICGKEMISGCDLTRWCGFCDIRFGVGSISTIKELKRKADMIDKGKKLFGFIIIKQRRIAKRKGNDTKHNRPTVG